MDPILDIVLRSIAVYFFIVFAIRLFGKKELAQLSVIDLVFILLISNSVQNSMVGANTSLLSGLVAAASLFAMNFILKFFLFKSRPFTKFLEGQPVILIHNGKVIEDHLKRQRISIQELEAVVREHGVASTGEVDLAVLEADGNISVLSENYQKRSVKKRKAHKVIARTS